MLILIYLSLGLNFPFIFLGGMCLCSGIRQLSWRKSLLIFVSLFSFPDMQRMFVDITKIASLRKCKTIHKTQLLRKREKKRRFTTRLSLRVWANRRIPLPLTMPERDLEAAPGGVYPGTRRCLDDAALSGTPCSWVRTWLSLFI